MRFKSKPSDGFQVFAVSGVNTVSFGITASAGARAGLLGFAVERLDPQDNECTWMHGFKVFRSVIPNPTPNVQVSTFEHPVQSFVWDDFTAKPGFRYEYRFHPLRGAPKNLDRTAGPIAITVFTEPLFSKAEHDVFFNRGAASSQAYARRFGNERPDVGSDARRAEKERWLARDLDTAVLRFIEQVRPGDTLLCCFYEFRLERVADALEAAVDRGADVRIIVDAKQNEYTDNSGAFHEAFPRVDNLETIDGARLPKKAIILREARTSAIAHNKFMVLLQGKGDAAIPTAVWTGSTNISLGAIAGQTNVGHWVRNAELAGSFRDYWTLLAGDPGGTDDDTPAQVRAKNADLRKQVEKLGPAPTKMDDIPAGVTPIFSPRGGLDVLDLYFRLVDDAHRFACITLAFGISKRFKELLKDNTKQQALVFMLLEKEDRPAKNAKGPFVSINASNNVYKAWGSYIEDPVYQWAAETNAKQLGLNTHVSYVHSKFLLSDPLSKDPIVVTGSANFSEDSTTDNDENMIIVRGDLRVADIYFTEFNRLFNHYYFRSVHEAVTHSHRDDPGELFLKETPAEWLVKYAPGTLRSRRVAVFAEMEAFTAA